MPGDNPSPRAGAAKRTVYLAGAAGALVAGGEDISPPLSQPTKTVAVNVTRIRSMNNRFMSEL